MSSVEVRHFYFPNERTRSRCLRAGESGIIELCKLAAFYIESSSDRSEFCVKSLHFKFFSDFFELLIVLCEKKTPADTSEDLLILWACKKCEILLFLGCNLFRRNVVYEFYIYANAKLIMGSSRASVRSLVCLFVCPYVCSF